MKLKGIFASLLAVLAFATACQKEADHYLDNIKVDQSYVGISPEGGSQTINLTATGSWTAASKVDWITITPASGSAGATTLTITAAPAEETRETTIAIECDGQTQNINVIQQAEKTERPVSTIAEVIAAGAGSFRVRGTVTKVANEQYGNFYVEDETGSIYIYGVKDSQGYPKDGKGGWARFGIEVGDIVTVEGPYTLYGSTHELVDAEVIKVEKSLIQIAPFDFTELPATDTTFTLKIDSKVNPILANIDADWLSFTGVNADGSYQLHAAANPRTAKRTATISFKGPGAQASTTVTQAGIPATGASVSEIIAMDDDSQVQTLPSTIVVALTTRGAVLSDGTKAIYAYGNTAAALKLGDGVQMSARKTTYNGVPELTDISDAFVDSEGNAVSYPNAKDITAQAGTYAASEAEYVKLSGTLSVSSDGKYYNIALDGFEDGSKQGSIVYPVEALNAKSFDGKKITVTGFFNGLSSGGKYINIIATKIAEFVDNPKGTVNNPYTASEIAAEILAGNIPEENVYVKGIVSAIQGEFSSGYGNATFWISDDGTAYGVSEDKKSTTEPSKDFECYRVLWFDNKKWEDGNAQISVGDEIVVYGKMTAYNGIAETSGNKAWVYSVNGATNDADGIGNALAPFNVAGAEAFIDRMVAAQNAAKEAGESTPVFPNVCVKGIVSAVQSEFSAGYGNGTFWISDDGKAYGISEDKKSTTAFTKDFECYRVLWFNNEKWADGDPQIAVGDEVIIKGQLTQYNGIYETSGNKAWIYSLNGKTE